LNVSSLTTRWHYFCEITKIVLKTETFGFKFCFSNGFFVFLYDQEVKNDLITDLNSHLTTFGQGLFDLLGVEYVVERNTFNEFEYVITFKN